MFSTLLFHPPALVCPLRSQGHHWWSGGCLLVYFGFNSNMHQSQPSVWTHAALCSFSRTWKPSPLPAPRLTAYHCLKSALWFSNAATQQVTASSQLKDLLGAGWGHSPACRGLWREEPLKLGGCCPWCTSLIALIPNNISWRQSFLGDKSEGHCNLCDLLPSPMSYCKYVGIKGYVCFPGSRPENQLWPET